MARSEFWRCRESGALPRFFAGQVHPAERAVPGGLAGRQPPEAETMAPTMASAMIRPQKATAM